MADRPDVAPPPTVFLSWSGQDSGELAAALGALIAVTFCGRIATWQSSRDLEGSDWRRAIQDAVQRSGVGVVAIAPSSLQSHWLMYEAGAFFEHGETFVIGCGVGDDVLASTPLDNLELWNGRDRSQVVRLVRSIGRAVGDVPADFDARFEEGWPAFAKAVEAIDGRLAASRRQARRRRRLGMAAAAASFVIGAGGALAWAVWPPPPPPPAAKPCAGLDRAERRDCQWKQTIAELQTTSEAMKNLGQRVSRRGFALVATGRSCQDAKASEPVLVRQEGQAEGWTIPLLFATSGADQGIASGLVAQRGRNLIVLRQNTCTPETAGPPVLAVLHFDSLSDNRVCDKLRTLAAKFLTTSQMAVQLALFLQDLELGTKEHLTRDVNAWRKQCGIPSKPEKAPS